MARGGAPRTGRKWAILTGVLALGISAWAVEMAVKLEFPWKYSSSYDIDGILPIPTEPREVSEPKLRELIRKELEADGDARPWEPRIEGDRFVVKATRDGHERVRRLLVQLRIVVFTSGFRNSEDNFLEEIGIDPGEVSSPTTFVPSGE